MTIKNSGYRTDAIFHEDHGYVKEKDDYFVIRTPSNPTFHWGNYLLFKSPPARDSYEKWLEIHYREFGREQKHIAFGWDAVVTGFVEIFESHGFTLNDSTVLRMQELPELQRINTEIEIRPVIEDWEWLAVTEAQIKEGFPGESDEGYREFKTRQMDNYRASQDRGRGHWWGAFIGGELVGDMGLFFSPDGKTGRFQAVETAPAHRRKGICQTLLSHVIRDAFENKKTEELFIVAERNSIPERIYQSVGFLQHFPQRGLWRANSS